MHCEEFKMKKLLAVALVLVFTLCSCSSEKIEGKALEKYLEIIDSLECGTVFVTSDASSNKATIQFRQGENGCEIVYEGEVPDDGVDARLLFKDGALYLRFRRRGTRIIVR